MSTNRITPPSSRYHVNENNTAILQVPRQRTEHHRHRPGTTSTSKTTPPSSRYHVNEQNITAIVQVMYSTIGWSDLARFAIFEIGHNAVIHIFRGSISEKSASLAAKLSFSKNRKCLKNVGGGGLFAKPFLIH